MGAESAFDELIARLRARDDAEPAVAAGTRSYARAGTPGAGVAVLLHGLTASPPALAALADALHACGRTVVVPRLLLHGYADRMTTALRGLTTEALLDDTAIVLAAAAALGEPLTIVGHSLGATLALDAAARLPSVARAVAIAPFVGFARISSVLHPLLLRAPRTVRRRYMWWDPVLRERQQPEHGYPRYPLEALAVGLAIAERLRALERPPAAAIDFVLAVRETTVSNRAARRLAERWRDGGASVAIHRLHDLGWSHDIVDPSRPAARAALPMLVDIIAGAHVAQDREHRVARIP